MKYLVLLFLLIMHAHFADAQNEQNNKWFEGSWNGIKSFTGARLGIRVLVRIEVDSVRDNRFYGHFIYMYPKDTIARLIKTFDGKFKRGAINLDKSKELYLLDPRSRSFWSDCSQCDEIASLYMNDSALIFKITTISCGDSCNGETVFARPIYRYDAQIQAKIKNFFKEDTSLVTAHIDPKQKNQQPKTAKKSLTGANKSDRSSTPTDKKTNIKTTMITSTPGFKLANKDSLSKTAAPAPYLTDTSQENPLTVTTGINAGQKEKDMQASKESFGQTANNGQSLNRLSDKKTTDTTSYIANTVILPQSLTVAGTDLLPQVNAHREHHLTDTSLANPLIVTTSINAGEKEKDIQTSRESFGHAANKDQPLTKLSDKKITDTTGNTANTVTLPPSLIVTGTDSLPQANANHEPHLTDTSPVNPLLVTTSIDPDQGNNTMQAPKENPADTGKNGRPLAITSDNKAIGTINNISKTVASIQTIRVSNIDSLQKAKINRETNLIQSYQVNSSHIKMELFDNAEIDADIVSVYYNGKLIVSNATLTQKAITFSVDASATNRHHEFILIAENEGALPPNTALLRITAGDKQYKLSVSTSGTKNAKIAVDYNGE